MTFELKGNSMCGKKNIYPDKKIDGQLVNLHNLKVCHNMQNLSTTERSTKTYENLLE